MLFRSLHAKHTQTQTYLDKLNKYIKIYKNIQITAFMYASTDILTFLSCGCAVEKINTVRLKTLLCFLGLLFDLP